MASSSAIYKMDGSEVVDFQAINSLQTDVTIDQPGLHRGPAPRAWKDRQVVGRRFVLALRANPTVSVYFPIVFLALHRSSKPMI
jgi:hypothetical protein